LAKSHIANIANIATVFRRSVFFSFFVFLEEKA